VVLHVAVIKVFELPGLRFVLPAKSPPVLRVAVEESSLLDVASFSFCSSTSLDFAFLETP